MSLRDTLLQLGFVLIAGGAVFATWALLTGPLGRFTRLDDDDAMPPDDEPAAPAPPRRARADGRRSGSSQERS